MSLVSVPIAPVGPASAATMLFRESGILHVTAIVKATFAFAHQAPMRLAAPEPVFTREVHRLNNPTRSIVATSDLVPRMPGVDVLLLGQAYAPGDGAARSTVRLAVGRGQETLLDKTVEIIGDQKGSTIKLFRTMPLVYEKAYGGPGFRDNPLGTGVLSGDPPPNLVDPRERTRAACFAPVSRTWPPRASLLSAEVRAGLENNVVEISPGFDLRYFHAAPPDQRMMHLLGDEWIVLEGVHPEHAVIQLQLPGPQAMVKVSGSEADGRIFSLRADTLRIDADAERCTVVWRNAFRLRESDAAEVRLLAGVALPDAPIAWPADAPPVERHVVKAPAPEVGGGGTLLLEDSNTVAATISTTIELADDDLESVQIEDSGDFKTTTRFEGTAVPVTAPLGAVAVKSMRDIAARTLDLSPDAPAPREVLPFVRAPAASAPDADPSMKRRANESSVTMDMESLDGAGEVDLAGTLASASGPAAAPEAPVRLEVRAQSAASPGAARAPITPPALVAPAIRAMVELPSIFANDSPDSAPTQLRPLAPREAPRGVEARVAIPLDEEDAASDAGSGEALKPKR